MMKYQRELKKERRIIEEIKSIEDNIKTMTTSELKNYKDMEKLPLLKIKRGIIHDNARYTLFNEVMAVFKEVLEQYNGKQYGEKTRHKINDEMKKRVNCSVYMYEDFRNEVNICLLNDQGYTSRDFSYNELRSGHYFCQDETPLLKGNKINIEGLKAFEMPDDCPDYVKNPEAKAKKILKQYRKMRESIETLKSEVYELNKLKPSNKKYIDFNPYNMEWYI